MKTSGKDIMNRFKKRWQLLLWLEVFSYAFGAAVLVYFLSLDLLWSFLCFVIVGVVPAAFLKPWNLKLEQVSSYMDRKLEKLEYSSGLLLLPQEDLPGLAKLQQIKVARELKEQIRKITPETHLLRAGVIAAVLILIGFLGYQFQLADHFSSSSQQVNEKESIIFRPADSASVETKQPVLESQRLTIRYPSYTGIPVFTTSKMDIKAVEGTQVTWQIGFDAEIEAVQMERMGTKYPMVLRQGKYSRTSTLHTSGFYNFRFTDSLGGTFVSDLYSIEVNRDRLPEIKIGRLKQFTSFEFDDKKNIAFSSHITDDFGVAEAYIIATVSKGTGESVKFREEKLNFDEEVERGSKDLQVSKKINLDQMNMEPGDELYFYVEATDLKQPRSNVARSETYFAVIKDTVSYGSGVEGTLGVDLMPEYFRSQRQLIIDTKKLISTRNKIPATEFNSTSNELGFDQKVLRLKYGQFMGDESESGFTGEDRELPAREGNKEDPLIDYIHDHDGENEHNLVEQDHEHEENEAEDPLAEYLHNHSDPEESTLFTDSLKSKLRQALTIMWDAELHLRLYEPEKSLPYQYKALALIQEIKNSARIYVHRIGFDPPPIREEVRLTGEFEKVSHFQKKENLKSPEKDVFMRRAVLRLEQLLVEKSAVTTKDRKLFEQAGNELATKAIEEPGKHLNTLQQLKWLTEKKSNPVGILREVQQGLLLAISIPEAAPGKGKNVTKEINELLLKELELNDQ